MAEIDKGALYGKFQAGEDQRQKFQRRVAHKALDIAMDDDVNINANKTGISTGGAVGIAAMAGIPSALAAALLGYIALQKPDAAPSPQLSQAELQAKLMAEYEIDFYDAEGNRIKVPHISEMPK
jgi:hypothetical protein